MFKLIKYIKKLEFSKILALVVTWLFVCTVAFVLFIWAVTSKTAEQLKIGTDILGVVATPFGIVITGYFAKSGIENFNKIKQNGGNKDDNT